MKQFCQNQFCDNPGAKVVSVSVERPSDDKRTLCVPCEEAYTMGVQHATKMTQAAVPPQWHTGLNIDDRQLATILAALRSHQDNNLRQGSGITDKYLQEIATNGGTFQPLSVDEVNALCERLNFDTTTSTGLTISPPPKETQGQRLFRVVYQIDIHATSPLRAAQQTHHILVDPDSQPPVVDVMDHNGRVIRIDLSSKRRLRQKGKRP